MTLKNLTTALMIIGLTLVVYYVGTEMVKHIFNDGYYE